MAHRPSAFPFWVNAQGIILLNPVFVADDVTSENLHKINVAVNDVDWRN